MDSVKAWAFVLLLPGAAPEPRVAREHVVLVRSARPFYSPDQVRIRAGESVRFVNDRLSDVHSVIETGRGTFSADLEPGQSFSFRFERAGQYPFSCRFHPWMRGEVVVDPERLEGRALPLPEGLSRPRLSRAGLLVERAPRPALARLPAAGASAPASRLSCPVEPEIEPAADSAGRIWFVAEGGRGLVALAPGGDCRMRALDARAAAVAAGSGEALWIHDQATGRLGEVRRSGGVRWHPEAGRAPGPAALAVDALGRVWRIGGTGEVSAYVPGRRSRWSVTLPGASSPAAAPDGALWLADAGRQKLIRLEPGREIAEVGAPGLAPADPALAVTADGAVWFALREPGRIGRISRGGLAEELEVAPWIERVAGILAGPAGGLWLLEATKGRSE